MDVPEPQNLEATTQVDAREQIEGLSRVQAVATRRGLRVQPNDRISNYISALNQHVADVIKNGAISAEKHAVIHATLAASQIVTIVDELAEKISDTQLQDLMSGTSTPPTVAPRQTKGRDLQAELLVAAFLARAGVDVELAEPDFLARLRMGTVSFAAKRSRSPREFANRVVDGGKQIARSEHRGIVVVDVSDLGSWAEGFNSTTIDLKDVYRRLDYQLKEITEKNEKKIGARISSKVDAILFMNSAPVLFPDFAIGSATRCLLRPAHTFTPEKRALMEDFAGALLTGAAPKAHRVVG